MRPPALANAIGSARAVSATAAAMSLLARIDACAPVRRSSRISASGAVGEPPKNAAKSLPTRMSRIDSNGVSISCRV